MRVQFVDKQNGPERLVCDAELIFDEPPLAGMKLVGISLWRSSEGDVNVTFPARSFGTGSERKYFDFLRAIDPATGDTRRVKAWILEEFRARTKAA